MLLASLDFHLDGISETLSPIIFGQLNFSGEAISRGKTRKRDRERERKRESETERQREIDRLRDREGERERK